MFHLTKNKLTNTLAVWEIKKSKVSFIKTVKRGEWIIFTDDDIYTNRQEVIKDTIFASKKLKEIDAEAMIILLDYPSYPNLELKADKTLLYDIKCFHGIDIRNELLNDK